MTSPQAPSIERSPGQPSEWSAFTAAQVRLLLRVLLEVVRDLSRRAPPPRGLPFLGLDHAAGELAPFDSLAARGIFRKYESVLLLGAGLGGAARWCHALFGCEVTGIDAVPAVAAAARELSARARLSAHTQFVAATLTLPLRQRNFTHVWAVEGMADLSLGDPRLRELFRVVRLGGMAMVQQCEARPDWAEASRDAMASVGFAEVAAEVVERPPLREAIRRARERLSQALRAAEDPLGRTTAEELERLYATWPIDGGPVTQVFGRRPS